MISRKFCLLFHKLLPVLNVNAGRKYGTVPTDKSAVKRIDAVVCPLLLCRDVVDTGGCQILEILEGDCAVRVFCDVKDRLIHCAVVQLDAADMVRMACPGERVSRMAGIVFLLFLLRMHAIA